MTEEATGKQFREMYRDGMRVQEDEWLREFRNRASGRDEAGCPPEDRPVPLAWLASVRRIKTVQLDGVHSTIRQLAPSAGSHSATGTIRTRLQKQAIPVKANTKALTVPALHRMCLAALLLSCVLLSACRQEEVDAALMVTEILIAGSVSDSCQYAFDGECDEPAYCAYGTDTTDCSGSSSSGYGAGNDSCQYAFDGECDEPAYCAYGTDTTDCSGSSSSGYGAGNDSCQYAFDGECDEPAYCAYGTDTTDCSGSSSAGHGEESDDSYWTDVPHALACISINPSVGPLGTQFIVNNCNHQVHVEWCYADRPDHYAQCDPGPPGLGLMDSSGHYMDPTPDFYWGSFDLNPKPDGNRVYGSDHSPILEHGTINYIACGYEHIEGAERYEMQWDAYTGWFRCLAHFPREEPYVPPEQAVQ